MKKTFIFGALAALLFLAAPAMAEDAVNISADSASGSWVFPGGDAGTLYDSIQKILSLHGEWRHVVSTNPLCAGFVVDILFFSIRHPD